MEQQRFGGLTKQYATAMLYGQPIASAHLRGGSTYPQIYGKVWLYGIDQGSLVVSEIYGLPVNEGYCQGDIFGYHIHEQGDCSNGDASEPFPNTGGHFNPTNCPHPFHVGDLPPLFGAGSKAFSAFITTNFTPSDVIGRSIVLHSRADDFRTQPSGDSGTKIACGLIQGSMTRPVPR